MSKEALEYLNKLEAKIRQKKGFYHVSVSHDPIKQSHKCGVQKGLDAAHNEIKQMISELQKGV